MALRLPARNKSGFSRPLLYNLNRLPTYDFLGTFSDLWPSLSMGARGISLPTSMKGIALDVGTLRFAGWRLLTGGASALSASITSH